MKPGCIVFLLIGLQLGVSPGASAQQWRLRAPDAERSFGPNRVALDMGVLGASLGYSRQVSAMTALGLAVGGGAQAGFMLSGELTGDGAAPLFVELASGAAFVRSRIGSRTEVEAGVRLGWLYHSSEYETIFAGVTTALQYRIGRLWVGPRIYWGRLAEEAGRTQTGFGVVPIVGEIRWSW
jgi:hypothetical protein